MQFRPDNASKPCAHAVVAVAEVFSQGDFGTSMPEIERSSLFDKGGWAHPDVHGRNAKDTDDISVFLLLR